MSISIEEEAEEVALAMPVLVILDIPDIVEVAMLDMLIDIEVVMIER